MTMIGGVKPMTIRDINYANHDKGKVLRKRTRDFREVYKIKEVLYRGSLSVIRRCYRREGRKNYAMKIVRKKRRSSKNMKKLVANMEKQVSILTQMNHVNICRLFDTYITPNYIHMVMEFCSGKELFETIHDNVEFSEEIAAQIIYQIADGIKHLHEHDIVHRDIKPENILCQEGQAGRLSLKDGEFTIKIVSFGFAKNYREDNGCRTVCGTPEYVAPEILNKDIKYYEKVDLWSLGVLMFILLVGYFPFDYDNGKESKKALYAKIRRGEVEYGRAWDGVSDSGKKLVQQLLQISPSKRATASSVLQDEWIHNHNKQALNDSALRVFQKQIKFRRGIHKLLSAIRFRDFLMEMSKERQQEELTPQQGAENVDDEPDTYE